MLIDYEDDFLKFISKIKDETIKEKVKKQIVKILENPEIGKPMKFSKKGTREVYVTPYRLSYLYLKKEEKIVFLVIYHKDEQ